MHWKKRTDNALCPPGEMHFSQSILGGVAGECGAVAHCMSRQAFPMHSKAFLPQKVNNLSLNSLLRHINRKKKEEEEVRVGVMCCSEFRKSKKPCRRRALPKPPALITPGD
jgi:hypothetical protein